MITKMFAGAEKLSKLGKSKRDLQRCINTSDVSIIWDFLVSRYDSYNHTKVLLNFVKDTDLKFILSQGLQMLQNEINVFEKMAKQYGIPTPEKPSENPVSIFDTEIVTDKYIFRQVFSGIQSFLPLLSFAFTRVMTPSIRKTFQSFIIEEMNIYNDYLEYGMTKSWINSPPAYRL